MAYTKGPWKVDDGDSTFRIRQTEGPWHCVAIVTGGVDADDESPQGPVYCANAQLIAAAPALYEALKAYRQHRDEHERDTAEVRLSEQPCRVCHERDASDRSDQQHSLLHYARCHSRLSGGRQIPSGPA